MKNLKIVLCKNVIKVMNVAAIILVAQTANSACFWLAHQPEFPEAAEKYKRVK